MTAPKMTTRQRDKLVGAAQDAPRFSVLGSGEFPVDMLRYDHCWPATEGDSYLIQHHTERREIFLRGLTGPTPGRWRSFGWECDPEGERTA